MEKHPELKSTSIYCVPTMSQVLSWLRGHGEGSVLKVFHRTVGVDQQLPHRNTM